MQPSFQDGDYLIIDKLSFRISDPERGDIVVFKAPLEQSSFYIKRIVGLPSETVEIKDGGLIVYNSDNTEGWELKESYLENHPNTPGNIKIKLQADEFFVLGDNREASYDSREWGSLKADRIVGKVWLRLAPINKVQAFSLPKY